MDGKPFLETHKKPMSAVVEGLTHSQGSIALISVMLAGFAFQGFTTQDFDYDELPSGYLKSVYVLFSITTSLTIASFLFVAVSCSMLEQNGLVARSLAISYDAHPDFDVSLKEWYMTPWFASFRRNLIYLFTSSFFTFSLFVALFCVLKLPSVIGEICGAIFLVMGSVIVASVVRNNKHFVRGVLLKSKAKV
ncbi:hypothetical protein TeGR_g873 [Tetraparma gracilis]|uniref:Uncharacterized protein n=1 Tax=Tetraparma gracilis TaxID=2962635 RepID=A0ABQ6MAD4_9STRA|nr:hypothetical protein TeGR_g873 [Tetraparma gracilis]